MSIATSQLNFAAIHEDGHVSAWGTTSIVAAAPSSVTNPSSRVVRLASTDYAFAAIHEAGFVSAWGDAAYGGTAPSSVTQPSSPVVSLSSTSCLTQPCAHVERLMRPVPVSA